MPAEWFEKHKLVLFGVLLVTIIALKIAQLATGRSNSPTYVATLVQLGAESRSLARPGAAHSYKRVLNSHATDKRTYPHPSPNLAIDGLAAPSAVQSGLYRAGILEADGHRNRNRGREI